MNVLPFFVGFVSLKSNLEIEEVGDIISRKVFGGLKFGGKELEIYEEVPAIFISSSVLGLRAVLQGYKGFGEGEGYVLTISSNDNMRYEKREEFKLDYYLVTLLRSVLEDHNEITVLDVDINRR